MRTKIKDMQQQMDEHEANTQSSHFNAEVDTKKQTTSSKGDYIDFEEVK